MRPPRSHRRSALPRRRRHLQAARRRHRREGRPLEGRAGEDHRRLRRPRRPLRHQGHREGHRRGRQAEGDRPRRHRRRQHRRQGGHRQGHHRHEHALRQLHHHRRARHLADDGAGPPDPRGRPLHPGRQVGEVEVPGHRAVRQDAGRHRLRQHRLDRRRPGDRPEDEGGRLRSLPLARARHGARRGEGRARRAPAPRRLHHPAHPAHRQDQEHHRRGGARQDQEGRAHRQLRARRPGRRAGAGRGA